MKPTGRILVDTNVLVYATEAASTPRHEFARAIVNQLWREARGVVALQNVMEFCSVCLHRLKPRMALEDLKLRLEDLYAGFEVLMPDSETPQRTLEGMKRHGLSYWDAALWAVAHRAGVVEILSGDFENGRDLDGVLWTHPF